METRMLALILLSIIILAACQPQARRKRSCDYKEAGLKGGHGWIQIGDNWRIGVVPNTKVFVFSHRSGYTPTYYNMWGNYYVSNHGLGVYTLWPNSYDEAGEISGVEFGNDYIEFLNIFKLGVTGYDHLSLSTIAYKTAFIWNPTGGRFGGPRQDLNGYYPPANCKNGPSTIEFGQDGSFIEIGKWRLGEIDSIFFSIGTISITGQLLRSDGFLWGKRQDFNLFHDKPLCMVQINNET